MEATAGEEGVGGGKGKRGKGKKGKGKRGKGKRGKAKGKRQKGSAGAGDGYDRRMVEIDVTYEGNMRCAAVHGPSKSTLSTDAPVDNHGRGESFSPTDLVATGLGTCMATVMGILARSKGWNIEGSRVHVEKEMSKTQPRKIARLPVRLEMGPETATLDGDARAALEHAANTCPVRLSVHEAIEVPVEFVWPSASR